MAGSMAAPPTTALSVFSSLIRRTGFPHWGQHVTFDVTSTVTYTFVDVDCYQCGVWVYRQGVGFYDGWPWSQDFILMSGAWTGGAADCNARRYSTNVGGTNDATLATMSFHVCE